MYWKRVLDRRTFHVLGRTCRHSTNRIRICPKKKKKITSGNGVFNKIRIYFTSYCWALVPANDEREREREREVPTNRLKIAARLIVCVYRIKHVACLSNNISVNTTYGQNNNDCNVTGTFEIGDFRVHFYLYGLYWNSDRLPEELVQFWEEKRYF